MYTYIEAHTCVAFCSRVSFWMKSLRAGSACSNFVCVCIYIHMYLYTYVSIYICIYIHMYLYTYVSMYMCMYLYTYVSVLSFWMKSLRAGSARSNMQMYVFMYVLIKDMFCSASAFWLKTVSASNTVSNLYKLC